jgi:uncharacterized glyoxalase superfamily protein PhnB
MPDWIETALADCPAPQFRDRLRHELERKVSMPSATGQRGVGYHSVMPYITVRDAGAFVAFAKEVFGATETFRVINTDGSGQVHFEMLIGDSVIMCGGGGTAFKGSEMFTQLHVYVADVDAVYQRALDAGAESLTPPGDRPYGERNAGIKDPAGNQWFIAKALPGTEHPPGWRAVTPYLVRPGALALIDFLKRAFDARADAVYQTPEGKVMHSLLWIGDSAIELGDGDRSPSALILNVPDCDAVYQHAMAAGAKSLFPPADFHWGVRMGGVEDPAGNTWTISTELVLK